ncbi:MAG: hypothetical protein ACR2QQ_04585 [Gammaproteobacteria bacterium]
MSSSAARTTSGRSSGIFHRLARWLYPFRVLIGAIGVGAVAAFSAVTLAYGGDVEPLYALAALTLLLWALWLLSVAFIFVEPAPELDPSAPFRRRVAIRFRRGLVLVLALLATALLFVAVAMTVRTLTLVAAAS